MLQYKWHLELLLWSFLFQLRRKQCVHFFWMDIADLVTNVIMSTQEMEVQKWGYLNFYKIFSKHISATGFFNLPSFPIKSYATDLHLYVSILFKFSEMCWRIPNIAQDVLKTSVVSGSQGFTSSSGPFSRLQSNSRASQQWSSSSYRNQVQLIIKPGLQQT